MKLELSKTGDGTIITSHDGREFQWNSGGLLRKSTERPSLLDREEDSANGDILTEINQYWATLSKETQDKIFNVYERIHHTFESVWSIKPLTAALQEQIVELLSYHQLEPIGHWVKFYSNVLYPDGLDEVFVEGADYSKTRNRTYTKEDYHNLVVMAIALRPVLPVWGLFIHRIKDEAANVFKEMKAFKLLTQAPIYSSPTMEKLRIYLSDIGISEQSRTKAVFSGLSSSDLPVWLCGMGVVRRLSLAKLSFTQGAPSIMAYIHNYIHQRISRDGGFSTGEIRDKKPERERADSDQKLSVLEQFKIKEPNPAGDTQFIGFNLSRQSDLLQMVEPNCPWSLVEQANQSIAPLSSSQIHVCQIDIMKNVLNVCISHQGITPQLKVDILSGMAVAQAVLIYRGHVELAALMTAAAVKKDASYLMTAIESRARIPREMFAELERYYPYMRRNNGRNRNSRQNNPAAIAIDSLAEKFSEHAWRLTLPNEYVVKLTGSASERYYTVPQNIRIHLAKFALEQCQYLKAAAEKALGRELPEPTYRADQSLQADYNT